MPGEQVTGGQTSLSSRCLSLRIETGARHLRSIATLKRAQFHKRWGLFNPEVSPISPYEKCKPAGAGGRAGEP